MLNLIEIISVHAFLMDEKAFLIDATTEKEIAKIYVWEFRLL